MNPITLNVASHLAALAVADPDRPALIVPRGRSVSSFTFQQLQDESDALANGLAAVGITAGTRVAVMVPPSLEFFTLTFALFKVAAVPVMIDPGMGMRNVCTCLAEAEPAAFVGIGKAHLARRLYGWAKQSITVNVSKWKWFCDHSTHSLRMPGAFTPPAVTADTTAAILFTSGSTGLAKGVVYTHGIFSAQVELLKQMYDIVPGEIDLCTFPLFALFGPALGMTCVVPEMNFSRPATIDAAKTIAAINNHNVTNLFGSPAVIRRLEEYGAGRKITLPTLKRAISAGAPATLNVIERFTKLLNDEPSPAPSRSRLVQVYTPYGATEALPVANIGSEELLATRTLTETGHGLCIGRPVAGITVHIIPIDDGPVPVFDATTCLKNDDIGEFVVRGPIVTKSYFRRDEATELAKMIDLVTGETLHRMGDVGYCDEAGRLWFCGRKSQRVVTRKGPLFADQVEAIFNSRLEWSKVALVGVDLQSQITPVIILTLNLLRMDDREVLDQIVHDHPLLCDIETYLVYSEELFPVDPRHNSKINREQLTNWAAHQLNKQ